jgi:arginyl-tRNA synthetase
MFEQEQRRVEQIIRDYCSTQNLPIIDTVEWKPIPFSGEWGISTSFFRLSSDEIRRRKKADIPVIPVQQLATEIASEIVESLSGVQGFSRIEAVSGYLNLYFETNQFSAQLINAVLEQKSQYGKHPENHLKVMVEFSQPNTHKAFHVGHLRNAILGSVICNIFEFAGYQVVRANYIGDIGLHVIKWMWNYQKYHNGEKPGTDKVRWMGDLYSEADNRLADEPELETEVRDLFNRWDSRDPEVVSLWEKTRQWSLEGFDQIYSTLGIDFDRIYFESEVEDSGKDVVESMIEMGIAEDERPEGPVIVRIDQILGLQKEKYRTLVILRSDGTSLYSTKDLSLAIEKFNEYDLYKSIYIVDVRQALYLQQIFKTLEIMQYPWADRTFHLAYEIVNLPGNVTMSSRDGTVVLLEDLIAEATQRALQIVEEKNPDLPPDQKNVIAFSVALGAIKYTMLHRDTSKMVTFDWDQALDFEGQAAPYIQYSFVRANSILRKVGYPAPSVQQPGHDLDPAEIELIDILSRFPGEVMRAAEDLKPLHLTNQAYETARAFNNFYSKCPVRDAKPGIREFRTGLVEASRQVLENNLRVLGIPAPEIM